MYGMVHRGTCSVVEWAMEEEVGIAVYARPVAEHTLHMMPVLDGMISVVSKCMRLVTAVRAYA